MAGIMIMQSHATSQVILDGVGPVTLRPNDHIATGGEGSVYRVGDLVVKMYLDPGKARKARMPEKIAALAKLPKFSGVIAPRGVVTGVGSNQDALGLYLPYADGDPMSLVFTNDYQQSHAIAKHQLDEIADKMREIVSYAHNNNALLVDANELNWLVKTTDPDGPLVIDVDSWQIGAWPAQVIMPSIRDWRVLSGFSELTDWFAWGIVTFQLYTGIHPYKGTLPGFERGDLIGRMRAQASVFAPGVKLNRAVRDFSIIPGQLRNWYEATFQKGERTMPPSPNAANISAAPAAQTMKIRIDPNNAVNLVVKNILHVPAEKALKVFPCGVVLMSSGRLINLADGHRLGAVAPPMNANQVHVVRMPKGWLVVSKLGARNAAKYIAENSLAETSADATSEPMFQFPLFQAGNRLFLVNAAGLTEAKPQMFDDKLLVLVSTTWGVMANSAKWFDGVGVMDALGAMYIIQPFGDDSVATVRIPELDGKRVVAGKSGNRNSGFTALIAMDKSGSYSKIELTFQVDYQTYKFWSAPADTGDLNMAILPRGVCAVITQDDELSVFVPSTGAVKKVRDQIISTNMQLSAWEEAVVAIWNDDVWSIKLK